VVEEKQLSLVAVGRVTIRVAFNDGRMDASPPTRELQTKVGYQKKRKMMDYPMVVAAAVKFYQCDQQDDKGIFPSSFGIFP
jgi:hypothetical protein